MGETKLKILVERCNEIEARIVTTARAGDRFRLRGELQAVTNAIQLLAIKKAAAIRPVAFRAGS